MTTTLISVAKFLCNEGTFERMKDGGPYSDGEYDDMTYDQFRQWNMACLHELSGEDHVWLQGLCARMKARQIKVVDEESCAAFTATKVYFNKQKKMCIMNLR